MIDPFEFLRRDLERLARSLGLGGGGQGEPIPSFETQGNYKVFYHATEPENVPAIMKDGLKPPVYLMNGRSTVRALQRATRRRYAEYGTYAGGYQVLLRIRLPKDWPLVQDEASDTPQYVKSLTAIPPQYISVDEEHWP